MLMQVTEVAKQQKQISNPIAQMQLPRYSIWKLQSAQKLKNKERYKVIFTQSVLSPFVLQLIAFHNIGIATWGATFRRTINCTCAIILMHSNSNVRSFFSSKLHTVKKYCEVSLTMYIDKWHCIYLSWLL